MARTRMKAPQRREQLIEVATRLFARSGYNATTTAAIAKAARVTEPVLYRHFKSKQAMFVAIVRRLTRQMLEYWEKRIGDEQDPARCLQLLGLSFPDQLKKLEQANHVLNGALATSRDRTVQAVMREYFRTLVGYLSQIIKSGQDAGTFRSDLNPVALAWQFAYLGLGYEMITLNIGETEAAGVEESVDFLLRGLKP